VDGNLIPWIPKVINAMEGNPSPVKVERTVTLRLVTDESSRKPMKSHLWPWEFTRILLGTMGAALENQRVPGELWRDTVLIRTGSIATLQFTLTQADKEELFRLGYDQVRRYFHKSPAFMTASGGRV
jgi:hypothetical protein